MRSNAARNTRGTQEVDLGARQAVDDDPRSSARALRLLNIYNDDSMIPTLTWTPEGVRFIDQTKLPLEESYVLANTYEQVADVIVTMVVRGAPAIGVSAAYGIALGALHTTAVTPQLFAPEFDRICARLAATRPTAVNLFWAIDRMKRLFATLLE